MSRIGKLPITIAKGVDVNVQGKTVRVKGPKGELVRDFPDEMSFDIADGKVSVVRANDEKHVRALHEELEAIRRQFGARPPAQAEPASLPVIPPPVA